jgi:hypothetical protein
VQVPVVQVQVQVQAQVQVQVRVRVQVQVHPHVRSAPDQMTPTQSWAQGWQHVVCDHSA